MSDNPELECISLDAYRIKARGNCSHYGQTRMLDCESRRVTCKSCNAEIDPFECLMDLALHHRRVTWELNELARKTEQASKRLEELLRQERNARSRVKRLEATP